MVESSWESPGRASEQGRRGERVLVCQGLPRRDGVCVFMTGDAGSAGERGAACRYVGLGCREGCLCVAKTAVGTAAYGNRHMLGVPTRWPPRVSWLTLAGGFYVYTSSCGPATI